MKGEFARFLAVGLTNTAVTYVIFVVLAVLVHHSVAYCITYIFGILFAYFLNSAFVFKARVSLLSFLTFPLVYAVQFGLGLLILHLLVDRLGGAPDRAMLVVIAVTTPITFLLSRFVLKRRTPGTLPLNDAEA